MIELGVVILLLGTLWLAASLIGVIFKLTFALIGGLFGLVASVLGLFFGGLALLVAVPLVALALLPVCLPALLLVAVIWAIAKAVRHPAEAAATPVAGTH
jgi:hypothetical protein